MTLISTSFHWLISGTCVWWCEGFRRSTVKLLQVPCWVSSERIRKRGRNSFPSSGDERNLISNTIFLKICVLYIPMYAGLKRILLSHLDYIHVLVFCKGMVSLRPFFHHWAVLHTKSINQWAFLSKYIILWCDVWIISKYLEMLNICSIYHCCCNLFRNSLFIFVSSENMLI